MSEQLSQIIKNKINKIPRQPGVYYFKNKKGEIIYIGKAKNLYKRINSHRLDFYKQKESAKSHTQNNMLSNVYDITWSIVESEADALIRESQEIKIIKPLYNVLLKDDKRYFYIVFTNNDFPKIKITHQPEKYSKKNVIGPFTSGEALKQILSKIRKTIPFCSCKNIHKHPCTNTQMGLCPGYCCLENNLNDQKLKNFKEHYADNLKKIVSILTGKRQEIITKIRSDLKRKILEEDFEKAEQLSLEIKSLENIFNHKNALRKNPNDKFFIPNVSLLKKILSSKILPLRIEAFDVSNIGSKYATGSMIVFKKNVENGKIYYSPNKKEYRIFHIKNKIINNDLDMLREIIMRRLDHSSPSNKNTTHQKKNIFWPLPQLVLIDGGKTQLAVATDCFNKINGNKTVQCLALAKRQEKLYTVLCDRKDAVQVYFLNKLSINIANLFKNLRNEAHRFAIKHHRKLIENNLKKI
ncbi:MAG: GIY-YIG nuclease family protein [Candidatus Paceibacterota bacterium]|jgi:excinuclease ABC subunit C